MNNTVRHIAGYAIGFMLFLIIIPVALVRLSVSDPFIRLDWHTYLALRLLISLPLLLAGLFFGIWSNVFLFAIGKGGPTDGFNVAISPRTKTLVTTGPYRYTRNPMVLGAFLAYFSIGVFMLSILVMGTVLVFLILIRIYLKHTEEKRLLKDFGDAYAAYRRNVPMIFPGRLNPGSRPGKKQIPA